MSNNVLYDILKNNRQQLPDFLKKDCSYEYLKKLLKDIENENINNPKIIEKLFLGKIGQENNKEKAIFELPTNELLTTIKFIIEFLCISHIEELCAGTGLLACMLKYKLDDNYTVIATDGNRWIQTSNNKKYYPVQNKQFLHYCLDENLDNKLLIISWLPDNDLEDLKLLINKKKPKYIIIIGNGYLNSFIHPNNYKTVIISTKQVCYKDYYFTNIFYPDDTSKSHIALMINDPNVNIDNLLIQIKFKYGNCLNKKLILDDKMIYQDMVRNYIMNIKLALELIKLTNNNDIKKIIKAFMTIMKHDHKVPIYLETYDEFIFWFTLQSTHKYPLLISNRDKFDEFKNYMNILSGANGIEELKNKGILSEWIVSHNDAENFIWLDFSKDVKYWKNSMNEFRSYYVSNRNMHNFNLAI
jgi:hypothetical protein